MGRFRALPLEFYRRPAEVVARDLLGRYLIRELDGERVVVRLVETEAYLGAPDRASHAWNGRRTARNASLYLSGGHAYVYFIYGMHHCLNAVTGSAGAGGAVLLRAAAPVAGGEGASAAGPGRLCRVLGVDRAFDGVRLDRGPLRLAEGEPVAARRVVRGPRVGVAYAGEAAAWPLRFAVAGDPHVSRPPLPRQS